MKTVIVNEFLATGLRWFAIGICLSAMFGHATETQVLTSWSTNPQRVQMAIPTCVAVIALALAGILQRRHKQ